VERRLTRITLDSFLSLGLLGIGDCQDEFTLGALYPVARLFIASDVTACGRHKLRPPDIVFPPSYRTLRYSETTADSDAVAALDFARTGIGALVLSRTCEQLSLPTFTDRATRFAILIGRSTIARNLELVCAIYTARPPSEV